MTTIRYFLKANPDGFANQPGYKLTGNPPRWHKTESHEQGKTDPKPAADNKTTASSMQKITGSPVVLTDEQKQELKATELKDNVNASAFNKKLALLLKMGEDGNATAILASGFGSNWYAKRLVLIANFLLSEMGVDQEVSTSQKKDSHPALKSGTKPPETVPDEPKIEEKAPVPEKTVPENENPVPDEKPAPGVKQEPSASMAAELPVDVPEQPAKETPFGIDFDSYRVKSTNTNTGVNKRIDMIEGFAAAGDVAGLVNMGFGSNWYAEKQVKLVNEILGYLNSDIKVHTSMPKNQYNPETLALIADEKAATAEPEPKPEPVADPVPEPQPESAPDVLKETPAKPAPKSTVDKTQPVEKFGEYYSFSKQEMENLVPDYNSKALIKEIDANPAVKANVEKTYVLLNFPEEYEMKLGGEDYGMIVASMDSMITIDKNGDMYLSIDDKHAKLTEAEYPLAYSMMEQIKANAAATLAEKAELYASQKNKPAPELVKKITTNDIKALKPEYDSQALYDEMSKDMSLVKNAMTALQITKDGYLKEGETPEETLEFIENAIMDPGMGDTMVLNFDGMVGISKSESPVVYGIMSDLLAKVEKLKETGGTGTASSSDNDGPKDGDTKQGADGTLIFKNGRWHKVGAGDAGDAGDAAGKPEPEKMTIKNDLPLDDISDWKQTGPQGGSNPGGKFMDPMGKEWYVKFPKSADAAKSEVLAANFYTLAGLQAQNAKIISLDGKTGIATEWVEATDAGGASGMKKLDGVLSGFAMDAWLSNWDVVGMGYDNMMIAPDGKAIRIDAGGSLDYRAQGELKGGEHFGDEVVEMDTMRDPSVNSYAASVFGKMKKSDILASVVKVLKISDGDIKTLVSLSGIGDHAYREILAQKLINRKNYLAKRYPSAAAVAEKSKFDPSKISTPPDFLNWSGEGQSGPSSHKFINQANHDAAASIYAVAQSGDVSAIEKLTAPLFNKETGAVTGIKPVLDHPSQHIKGYAQQVVNEINNMAEKSYLSRVTIPSVLHTLAAAAPAILGNSMKSATKVGEYLLAGSSGALININHQVLGIQKVNEGYKETAKYSGLMSPKSAEGWKKLPQTQKQALKSYCGSGYSAMNKGLWAGNPDGQAKSAMEAMKIAGYPLDVGLQLKRRIHLSSDLVDKLMQAEGAILQEPAFMSTSIKDIQWGGNVTLKMTVGPGVSGLYVGGSSAGNGHSISGYSSEEEVILPPNTRLAITKVTKENGGCSVECIVLPNT
ncbi:hypothetical protein [Morganella phage Mecenats66]|nr:hypothetical protein [Morganella phage Mecenats66]